MRIRTHRRKEEQDAAEAKIAAAAAIVGVQTGLGTDSIPVIMKKVREVKGELIKWRIVATCQVTGYREYMVRLFWDDEALGKKTLMDHYYIQHAHPVSLEFTRVPEDTPILEDPTCVDCNKIHTVSNGNVCQPCVVRLGY